MLASRLLRTQLSSLLLVVALASGCASLFEPSIEDLMSQGIEFYEGGRYLDSIGKFEEVIRRDSTRWVAYLYVARSFLALTNWSSAIANARKAFELAPGESEVIEVLGRALLGGGLDALRAARWSDAIAHLVEYLGLRPDDAQGYLSLARAHAGNGDLARAGRALLDGFTRAEGARPEFLKEMLRVGSQALANGDARTAAPLIARYVQDNPRDLDALIELGKAYWQTGERGAALEQFRKALGLNPGNREALRYLPRGLRP